MDNETDSDATTVSYGYNNNRLLSELTTDSTTYSFTYDGFSNPLVTKAGDVTLNTNTYGENNGNLFTSTYGNGFIKDYMYDKYDRITGVKYNGTEKYTYSYNADGLL